MKHFLNKVVPFLVVLLLLSLISCAKPTPSPIPKPSPSPSSAPTTAKPATPSPSPTPTPVSSPTASPAPTPSATPTFKPMTLVWASGWAPTMQSYTGTIKPWMEAVTQRTGGAVKFQEAPTGTLIKSTEAIEGLGKKLADLGYIQATGFPAIVPGYKIVGLQSPVEGAKQDSYQHTMTARTLFHEFPFMSNDFEKAGVIPLFTTASEPMGYFSTKPVLKLADFKGQRVRIWAGTYQAKLFSYVGSEGVTVALGDMYSAAQKGIVDGSLSVPASWWDLKLYEVTKHVTYFNGKGILVPIAPSLHGVNKQVWEGLPKELKMVMLEEAKRVEKEYGINIGKISADALAAMVKAGMQVHQLSNEESIAWGNMMLPLWDELIKDLNSTPGLPGTEYVNRYRKLTELSTADLEKLFEQAWNARFAALK